MASAWGKSFGVAWGNSWGVIETQQQSGHHGGGERISRVKLYADDEAVMRVIMKFVTRNPNG